jgi:membrane-bound lytic murein transglycosylase D
VSFAIPFFLKIFILADMRYFSLFLCVFMVLFSGVFWMIPDGVAGEQFPVHDSMRPNVEFWTKIYSKYPSTKGIIHDSHNLAVVYEVIDLKPLGYGSRKTNKRRIRAAKGKYKKILKTLAQGKVPRTKLEKKVYKLFGKNPTRDQFRNARNHVRFQLGQKDRYLAGLIRSGQYLTRIKTIFKSYGLPEDLAYLPHVESSFNYKAYSKFGAAGIWQFTRTTGRRYMTVDYVVDERRDPIVASRAAARYLKANYDILGSWPFALTAYNHGENGMIRAKKKHGCYKNVFDKYDGRRFGFASRNFYPSFIAARSVAKNYRKYFGSISLDRPVLYHTVEMPGFASVASVSKFFHISPKSLQSVNPALRPPVFQGQKYIPKNYMLRLPGKARRMARMANAMPSSMFYKKQKRSKFYRVQRGDTAGKIARQHRISVSDLVIANGLSRRATIYVGQNLRIPGLGEKPVSFVKKTGHRKPAAVAGVQSPPLKKGLKWKPSKGPSGLVAAREGEVKPIVVAQVEPPKPPEVVKPEPVVAARVEVSVVPDIVIAPVKPEPVVPVVHPPDIVTASGTPEAAVPEKLDVTAEPVNPYVLTGNFSVVKIKRINGLETGQIQVETDETLGHYADWLDIPTKKIRRLNRYRYGRPIQYGQKLRIPFGRVTREEFEERRYLYHKELIEDFYQAFTVSGEKIYEIKQGDTLWKLCHERFDMPFWLLKQYNPGFNFKSIHPGNQIKVPVIQSPDDVDVDFVTQAGEVNKRQPVLLAVHK